ncbi:MAG: HAMP domain-containing histidine kinase [Deltaproteobacteria bacterium]|nr:HAMP domain-containing histidine kinase [Deltaproteobacteria bacterium]MCB9786650.1 HAMP domain-containing histidine kinase [Deltaproteobacteria bacterium]
MQRSASTRSKGSPARSPGPLVLVVDDSMTGREILTRRLRQEGYEMREAENGEQALAIIASEPIELVLLDVTMPGMSGLDVLAHIREEHDLAALPVLMVTALGDAQDVVVAMERGANDYLTKPVEYRILLARVRTALELKRLHDQREHFLRVASHDLKNPLLAVVGTAELLEMDLEVGRPARDRDLRLLRNIQDAGIAAQRIVRDLVDAHALEDGQLVVRRDRVDMRELIAQVVQANTPRASTKGITLSSGVASPLPAVIGDETRLRQVLDNLVSNAVKFSEKGSETQVTARETADGVRVEVVDGGPGLRDGDLRLAFGKYSRLSARPTGQETSTGLGLAIVAELVRMHGGTVGLHNNEGAPGATFWFELPAAAQPEPLAAERVAEGVRS